MDVKKLLKQFQALNASLYLIRADRIGTVSNRIRIIKRALLVNGINPIYTNKRGSLC